ncbi:hypothetical protein ACQB60_15840 [Actinomycetota bacterium Odt1-20B]
MVHDGRSLLPELLDLTHEYGIRIRSVAIVAPDLESAFLHVTGTALRE